MRITKQTSGGRGEYEIADTGNGLTPRDLIYHEIYLYIGEHYIRTGVRLLNQGGKRRLRQMIANNYVQVHRQIAAILMMPKPIREEGQLVAGQPVLQDSRYIIHDIMLDDVKALSETSFSANVVSIIYGNQSHNAEQINVTERIKDVEAVWRQSTSFPRLLTTVIQRHEIDVLAGEPITSSTEKLVEDIQLLVQNYGPDLGIFYTSGTDVIPSLVDFLRDVMSIPPPPLNQIEPDQIELRKRVIKKWQQYVNRRGAASIKFREDVRQAYDWRCVMCGSRFPTTSYNQKPGVDAAHILPWADYDLDTISNGIALCKLHHWAFDEGLLQMRLRNGNYFVELSQDAEESLHTPLFSIDVLRTVVGQIPEDRLPVNLTDRPRSEFLQRLSDEYGR